ncbi:hypothetical protein KW795_02915 [Candidatus Microgenomates bacterium]|nr:hypothetical protein [Candidatus Microgenomates bacterium]
MTKYKETVQKMLSENKQLFDEFKLIHDRYGLEGNPLQDEFNNLGKQVMKIIREYENKLCNRSEGNGYASFTGNLAQKFMDEIRHIFPLIDRVGLIVIKKESSPTLNIPQLSPNKPGFSLKKITLT